MTWDINACPPKVKEMIEASQAKARVVNPLGTIKFPTLKSHVKRAQAASKPKKATTPQPPEKEVLKACLDLLARHPKIAFAFRANAGAMKVDKRFMRFGFVGQPDIIGQLVGGKALWIEVKRKGRKPNANQAAFLAKAQAGGGAATWVDDAGKLAEWLETV